MKIQPGKAIRTFENKREMEKSEKKRNSEADVNVIGGTK